MDKSFTIFLTFLTIVVIIFFSYKAWTESNPDTPIVSVISKAEAKDTYFKGIAHYFIVKDEEYGCEYIKIWGEGGLTPRITSEGNHAGCKPTTTDTESR